MSSGKPDYQEPVFSDGEPAYEAPAAATAHSNSDKNNNQQDAGSPDSNNDAHPEDNRQLQFLLTEEEARSALLRENEEKERQVKNLKADPWRFAVAPIFVVLSISNAMQWIAFSPIVNEVRDYFSMSATQVNFLATTYVIAYVAIVFLSCKLYEVTGIKNGVLVSAVTNAMGSLLKIIALYAWPHAALLYIAQVFNSFTEVLTIATPPLISNRWFPESERIVANTVMSSALNFGCGIGVLIPTFFVGPDKQDKKHFGNFFWFHFALCFLMLGLVIVLFPKKPRYAASFAADRQQSKEEERLRALDNVLHRNDKKHKDSKGKHDATSPDAAEDENAASADQEMNNNHNNSSTADAQQPCSPVTAAKRQNNVEGNEAALALASTSLTFENAEDSTTGHAGRKGSYGSSAESPLKKKKSSASVAAAGATENDDAVEVFERDSFLNDTETTTSAAESEVEPVNVFSVLLDCFREARRNYSFCLLMLAAAAELGLIWAVATVLPQMLMPYGVSEAMSGWIGFLNLVLGTVVCPFFMPLVERFGRRYKLILCTLSIVLLVNMVLLTVLLHFGPKLTMLEDGSVEEDNSYYVIITFVCWGGVSGLCQNFMMPLMFEYVVELTFPMAESTSAPCLTWAACLTNFILTLVFGEVLGENPDENHSLRVFIGSTVVTAVGAAALIFTKPMHKRRDYENLKKEEQMRLAQEIVELRFTIDNNNNNRNTSGTSALDAQAHGDSPQERRAEFSDVGSHHSQAQV